MIRTKAFSAATAAVLAIAIAGCGGGSGGGKSAGGSTGAGVGVGTPGVGNPGGPGTPGTGGSAGTGTGGGTTGATVAGTTFAFVTNFTGDAVDVYDVATGQPVSSIFTIGGPSDISIDGGKTALVVPHLKTRELITFDPATYGQTGVIDLSTAPMTQYAALSFFDPIFRFGYRPASAVEGAPGKVYVPGLFSVTVVQGGAPVKGILDLDASLGTGFFALLNAPVEGLGAFRAAAANGKVYVTNFLSNTVSVIDTVIDDVVATIPVGRAPTGIAIDRNGTAWVACTFAGEVWTIDTATDLVQNTIVTGVGPVEIAVDDANGLIYVANYLSGDIAKIDGLTGQVVDLLAPSSLQSLMAALGMSPAQMQAILNQMLAGLGGAGSGGTTTGGLGAFLTALLGGGGTGGGGIVAALLQQVLNSFFAQLGQLPNGGAMPVAGIWGIDVTEAGDLLVVSNSVTGEVTFVDTATKDVKFSQFPLLSGGGATGTIPFPIITSVEIVRR